MRSTITAASIALAAAACSPQAADADDDPPDTGIETRQEAADGLPEAYAGNRPVTRVVITATDYELDPTVIRVHPGHRLEVTYRNQGQSMHRLEFSLPDDVVVSFGMLDAGVDTTESFVVPTTLGSYRYHCPVSDHAEEGMQGVLVVEAPDAAAPDGGAEVDEHHQHGGDHPHE